MGDQAIGYIPTDLEKLCLEVVRYTNKFGKNKKGDRKEKPGSSPQDHYNQMVKIDTLQSFSSDTVEIQTDLFNMEMHEIVPLFMSAFIETVNSEGQKNKIEDFVRIKANELLTIVKKVS